MDIWMVPHLLLNLIIHWMFVMMDSEMFMLLMKIIYEFALLTSIQIKVCSFPLFSLFYISTQNSNSAPVSTFAGNGNSGVIDGPSLSAEFNQPFAILFQSLSSAIFVKDMYNGPMFNQYSYMRKIQNGLFKPIIYK